MSDFQIQVNNKEIVTRKIVTSIKISVVSLELHSGCTLRVMLMSDDNDIVDIQHIEMRGDDYKLWGIDDSYCYRFAAQKLGLTLKIV
jgi:hypothetical protein